MTHPLKIQILSSLLNMPRIIKAFWSSIFDASTFLVAEVAGFPRGSRSSNRWFYTPIT